MASHTPAPTSNLDADQRGDKDRMIVDDGSFHGRALLGGSRLLPDLFDANVQTWQQQRRHDLSQFWSQDQPIAVRARLTIQF